MLFQNISINSNGKIRFLKILLNVCNIISIIKTSLWNNGDKFGFKKLVTIESNQFGVVLANKNKLNFKLFKHQFNKPTPLLECMLLKLDFINQISLLMLKMFFFSQLNKRMSNMTELITMKLFFLTMKITLLLNPFLIKHQLLFSPKIFSKLKISYHDLLFGEHFMIWSRMLKSMLQNTLNFS